MVMSCQDKVAITDAKGMPLGRDQVKPAGRRFGDTSARSSDGYADADTEMTAKDTTEPREESSQNLRVFASVRIGFGIVSAPSQSTPLARNLQLLL